MSTQFEISSRITEFVKYLHNFYQKQGEDVFCDILKSCLVRVHEEWSYDNWDGGTYGHAIFLYIPEELLIELDIHNNKNRVTEVLTKTFNKCADSISNEFIEKVFIEPISPTNEHCKKALNPFNKIIVQGNMDNIWKSGLFKLFISHRDRVKLQATELSIELEKYGISCFVAHDSIVPMSEWQPEIEKALFTMDALLVFLTKDFCDSVWTDQEVGVAIGRNIPVIPLKLEKKDPHGLISKYQALKGSLEKSSDSAKEIFEHLLKLLPNASTIRRALIQKYVGSKNFDESILAINKLLPIIDKFEKREIEQIVEATNKNDQLYTCHVVQKGLPNLMWEKTGEKYDWKNGSFGKISELVNNIPF